MAAIHLDQHARLRHAFAADPVLGRASSLGAGHASLGQDATHRLASKINSLPFPQQVGEVGVVCA